MLPMFFDPTIILVLPALLFALWAQHKVKSAYSQFSQVGVRSGLTGAKIANLIMRKEGVPDDVEIEPTPGEMTDHYDPTKRVVRLSEGVYGGRSIAALGIAAHEVGHAIQHARSYAWLGLRTYLAPAAQFGSTLAMPLFFGGLILGVFAQTPIAFLIMKIAIWLFGAAVAFTLITLPVEFDASKRAVHALADGGYLTDDELSGVKQVLNAAALTYVAAAAMAISQLLRFIMLASMMRE